MNQATLITLSALALGTLAAALYAVIGGVGDWASVAVVAGAFLAATGIGIAIDPLRRS